jgi:hypothetical protein
MWRSTVFLWCLKALVALLRRGKEMCLNGALVMAVAE